MARQRLGLVRRPGFRGAGRERSDNIYYLASRPVAGLDAYVPRTVNLGDVTVDGTKVLDYTGISYEVTTDITWSQLTGAGLQLRRSPSGGRHIDAGIYADYAFLNRRGTVNVDTSGRWQESHTPFDPSAGTVKLRILVDRTSVEMFDDGRYVQTSEDLSGIWPRPEALVRLMGATDGEIAVFRQAYDRIVSSGSAAGGSSPADDLADRTPFTRGRHHIVRTPGAVKTWTGEWNIAVCVPAVVVVLTAACAVDLRASPCPGPAKPVGYGTVLPARPVRCPP